jgi:cytochrome b pre-mRNA-processing protein 3
MHKLAGDFYGRLEAYAAALAADQGLAAAIGRNMLGDETAGFADDLARYVQAAARVQAGLPVAALGSPEAWPAPGR